MNERKVRRKKNKSSTALILKENIDLDFFFLNYILPATKCVQQVAKCCKLTTVYATQVVTCSSITTLTAEFSI
jgi:hypothetical protein